MNKKIILLVVLAFLAVGGTLIGVFWDPILDWLPIDQSGWDVLENGGRCYLDEDGDPVSGWQELDGKRFYFSGDGTLDTGFWDIGGKRYYLESNGVMYTGWLDYEGRRRYGHLLAGD